MDADLKEVHDFIADTPPFDGLPEPAIQELLAKVTIRYLRSGVTLPPPNVTDQRIYLVRTGALGVISPKGRLLDMLGEGDICSEFFNQKADRKLTVKTEEDSLLYTLPCDDLVSITKDYPEVSAFFVKSAAERLKQAVASMNEEAIVTTTLMSTTISELFNSPAVTIDSGSSIRETAMKMTELGFSSLMIVKPKNKKLVGIVTDKDIRRRCVSAGLSIDKPVDEIMSTDLISITRDENAFDALMTMTRRRIHHLPVVEEKKLLGMVTVTDLIRQEGQNTVHLTGIVAKAKSVNDLVAASKLIPRLHVKLAKLGTSAEHVGKGVTAVTIAITLRLIEFAEQNLGPPPVPYQWVAAGSQARQEQTSHSDQDNGLIISDRMKPKDARWFEAMAKYVSDGLAACGYIYCPGDVMATNPKWRQTQSVWTYYFDSWVQTPKPMALMYSSIFFDLSSVYGSSGFLKEIRTGMLKKTKSNTLFLSHLVRNALKSQPPLGFFRDFVLVQGGKNKVALDIKHNGVALVVDLARIYALSEGIPAVNTIERLKVAAGTPSLSKEGAADLIDAFEFLGALRIQHQARQIADNISPDNFLSPAELSKLEREHMKEAFKVIRAMQSSLKSLY
jgi:CBS domain-containing protein